MKRILFVCTGNICRSPSAQAVLQHEIINNNLQSLYQIDSAGTHDYHVGERPDHRAIKVAKERGISMDGILARQVSEEDFINFDEIIALDEGHYKILESLMPNNSNAALSLFMDYVENHSYRNVPDPYYGDESGFEEVLDLLEIGVQGILKRVK